MTLEETAHGFRARLPAAWSTLGCFYGSLAEMPYPSIAVVFVFLLLPLQLAAPQQVITAAVVAGVVKLVSLGLVRWLDTSTLVAVELGKIALVGPFGTRELPLHTEVKAFPLDMGRMLVRFGPGAAAIEVSTTVSPAQIERFLRRLREEQQDHGDPDALPQALRQLQER